MDPAVLVDLRHAVRPLRREAAGPAYDDPAACDRDRVALSWWLHPAELAVETGLI